MIIEKHARKCNVCGLNLHNNCNVTEKISGCRGKLEDQFTTGNRIFIDEGKSEHVSFHFMSEKLEKLQGSNPQKFDRVMLYLFSDSLCVAKETKEKDKAALVDLIKWKSKAVGKVATIDKEKSLLLFFSVG